MDGQLDLVRQVVVLAATDDFPNGLAPITIFADVFDQLEQCTRDLMLAVVVENEGSLESTNQHITEAFQAEDEKLDLISAKLDRLMELVAGGPSVTT